MGLECCDQREQDCKGLSQECTWYIVLGWILDIFVVEQILLNDRLEEKRESIMTSRFLA